MQHSSAWAANRIQAGEQGMTFQELQKGILKYNAKSEYKQIAIVMLRTIFEKNGKLV